MSSPRRRPAAWIAALGAPRGPAARRRSRACTRCCSAPRASRSRRAARARTATELDDLALQAADDALVAILAKLDTFRGESRFTTWAYKFALLEAAVKVRRRAWQGREVPLERRSAGRAVRRRAAAGADAETPSCSRAIREAIADGADARTSARSSSRSTLNGVPIDVLAERLGTTRGALYKTLHDARRKLRAELAAADGTD